MEYKAHSPGRGSYIPSSNDPQTDSFSPRSQTSSNFGGTGSGSYVTPRDDRFYTPRAYSNSADNSEWGTPRIHSSTNTPRDPRFGSNNNTPRKAFATPRQGSDNDIYESPRGATPRDVKDTQGYNNYDNPQQTSHGHLPPRGFTKSNFTSFSANDYKSENKQDPGDYNEMKYTNLAESITYLSDDKYMQQTSEMYETLGISEQDVLELFSYARHGRSNDIERKLDEGIPIDVRDEHGNTLLTIASQNGNKKVAKTVLRRGANINSRNYKGNTPLHFCFYFGYGDSLGEYLISKGADTTLRNNAGRQCFDGI